MQTRSLEYQHDGTKLEGHLAIPNGAGRKPLVLVVHEWKGINDYSRGRAEQLAGLGYVGFAIDMYGKGVQAKDADEAARLMKPFVEDRKVCRARINAALAAGLKQPEVDTARVAAIGYCFGGLAALELGRSGAELKGIATFHANLSNPHPADDAAVRAKVLVCTGAADGMVPAEARERWQKEMDAGRVDWQMNVYGGAVHSFTFPGAGSDPFIGFAYHPSADRRSWQALQSFLAECLG